MDADDDGFVLDEFEHADGDDAAQDPDGSGLELGDAQAEEIRQIFITTLPQYLEPLAELMEQALGQAPPDPAVVQTLQTTVTSILEAAQRIGVSDIATSLLEMKAQVAELGIAGPEAVADDLRATLKQIEAQAGMTGGAGGEESPTLVAALGAVEHDLDPSVLERLTAAGLVTVSQLRMARKHEIRAVSGLDEATVDALLAALGIEERAGRARRISPALQAHLAAQVDAEEALTLARDEVRHARRRVDALKVALERAEATSAMETRQAELRAALDRARAERARALAELSELDATHEDLETQIEASGRRIAQLDADIAREERENAAVIEQVGDLEDRVRMLLATVEEGTR